MDARKGISNLSSMSGDNDYLGSTANSGGVKTSSARFSKFYNHKSHGKESKPSSALTQNRVFQYISSESHGEKVIKQQE